MSSSNSSAQLRPVAWAASSSWPEPPPWTTWTAKWGRELEGETEKKSLKAKESAKDRCDDPDISRRQRRDARSTKKDGRTIQELGPMRNSTASSTNLPCSDRRHAYWLRPGAMACALRVVR